MSGYVLRSSVMSDSAIPWTVARQAPLSMGFSRPEYWSGLPSPSPGTLPDPGIEPRSLVAPALASRFFTTSVTWNTVASPKMCFLNFQKYKQSAVSGE